MISKEELPSILRSRDYEIIRQFENDSVGFLERHRRGYQRSKGMNNFHNLEERRGSWEFKLLLSHLGKQEHILEIGCLTGHNLINLALQGYYNLVGVEMVQEAISWGATEAARQGVDHCIDFIHGEFPSQRVPVPSNMDNVDLLS